MTNPRFLFRRLSYDLRSEILKTMDYLEIIAYSLTSKKALSLVQSLHLSHEKAQLIIGWSRIWFKFGHIKINWKMGENNEEIMSLYDIPVNVDLSTENTDLAVRRIEYISLTLSNQNKSVGEWVHHLCSIFRCERYEAEFHIGNIRFDIPSLRKNFPKLKGTDIKCFKRGPNEIDIQSAENILRAFLPYVETVQLYGVPFQENLFIQHIGMAHLKELKIYYPRRNPQFEDFLTLNVECSTFQTRQFSLRDLNRVFKLWKKGSFPKLKNLMVLGETIPDWSVLLKGLQAEETEREIEYTIRNCYGILAKINTDFTTLPTINFLVLN